MAASAAVVGLVSPKSSGSIGRLDFNGERGCNYSRRVGVGVQQSQDSHRIGIESVTVSRRWAALVLPFAGSFGGNVTYPGNAIAGEKEQGNCSGGWCGTVQLRTLDGCGLGVARYPDFVYNAGGGGGSGEYQEGVDGRTLVRFDPKQLNIPAVSFRTTTLLGLPLPPPLQIEIVPQTFEGYVDRRTGKVELSFLANFNFSVGTMYSAPSLVVNTMLTTETAQGVFRSGRGKRLDSSGACQLVGVAEITPVNDLFLNTFLTLPTDCLAEMSAQITFI